MKNIFFIVASEIAMNKSISDIAKMHDIPESKVLEIANSLDDPNEAYQMQIEQNFFDKYKTI